MRLPTLSLSPRAQRIVGAVIVTLLVARAVYWMVAVTSLRWAVLVVLAIAAGLWMWRRAKVHDTARQELERRRAAGAVTRGTPNTFDATPGDLSDEPTDEPYQPPYFP